MNIQVGFALKKVARAFRSKSKKRAPQKSYGILGKTFKLAGKLGLGLTHFASIVLLGKL